MPNSLEQLAALVDGTLVDESKSDSASKLVMISGANPPRDAIEGEVTMIDDAVKASALHDSLASAVVTPAALDSITIPQIVVECPHTAFARLIETFRPPRRRELPRVGIDPTAAVAISASVHPTATVGGDVVIGENSLVMPGVVLLPGVKIGDDCVIHANVTLYEDTRIGDRVTIHAGSVIGAYGFGYRQVKGQHVRTAQLGFVAVEDDVEIGASVTIDRGTYGATRIGRGTKIDNQVMIAHNCRIGRHNLICSQVGIAGSCTTGDHVILAGQVGLKDHITLGDHTIVGAQAGVMDDCDGHQVYLGSPATPQRDQMQIMAVERKLPEMRRELKALRRDLDRFTRQDSSRDAA